MMSIYPIVGIQLSFVQFSLLCYESYVLSKTECKKSIYYKFSRDHERSSFRKLARSKSVCQETCDFFSWSISTNRFEESLFWVFCNSLHYVYLFNSFSYPVFFFETIFRVVNSGASIICEWIQAFVSCAMLNFKVNCLFIFFVCCLIIGFFSTLPVFS